MSRLAQARAMRAEHGRILVEAATAALPMWVERAVLARLPVERREDPEVAQRITEAAAAAVAAARPQLTEALAREPGVGSGPSPLQVLRGLVRFPTGVLQELGVAGVDRPDFDRRAFPDDAYALSPATWSDIDPTLAGPGVAWGAATAYVHDLVHRSDGAAPEG